jgi:phosphohistidine phosphatase
MELYIIRHAWAGHAGDPQWANDAERPLSRQGQGRFAAMVGQLAERGFAPGVIATSPLVRCSQTAQLVSDGLSPKPEVVALDELRPGSDLQALLTWTIRQAHQHDEIAWVGHAPDVGRLAAELIGEPRGAIHFPKGGIAAIRFEGLPQVAQGELRWLISAKVLGC